MLLSTAVENKLMRSGKFIYPHLSIASYAISESFQSLTKFHVYVKLSILYSLQKLW